MGIGELLSLGCALSWAFAVIIFKRCGEVLHPIGLNLFKNTLAFILFIPTMWIIEGQLFWTTSTKDYLILIISGFVGMGIADMLYFKSLNILGASVAAIIDCMYSPFVILLSMFVLGEGMQLLQWFGTAMVLASILIVTCQRKEIELTRKQLISGTLYAAAALFLMAVGLVIMKPILNNYTILWVIQIRLLAGIVSMLFAWGFHKKRVYIYHTIKSESKRWPLWIGSILGAYIAMIGWIGGFKYTSASIAAVLNQTSTIFIILFAAWFLKEQLTRIKVIGAFVASLGVVLITV